MTDAATVQPVALNLELDTSVAVFNWLPEGRWLRGVELEGSLDYVATGLPRAGDRINRMRFVDRPAVDLRVEQGVQIVRVEFRRS